ncbi:MAG: MbnP family protein, partial [Flavobacteriales bacterium]
AELLLGLTPTLNVTGGLPNTMDNINMAWPDPMGGGYHFIKFEGHFTTGGTSSGYAMHIGKNDFLPHCDLPQAFTITGSGGKLLLTFNLNEVFRTPNTYDLAAGNYSMGNMGLMTQLKENCANAFTIAYQP